MHPDPPATALTGPRGGFSPLVTVGLALLAVPRVVLHDLDVVGENDPVNLVLVFGPPLVWIGVALAAWVPNPLRALAWVGAVYGVLLALSHQILWDRAFGDDPPALGGNLEGELSATAEEIVLRGFAVASSIATGLVVGVLSGLVARTLARSHARG